MATKKRRRKKKNRGRIFLIVLLLFAVIGLGGLIGALKLFEVKTGTTLQQCIREGKQIAANSTKDDFLKDNITYIYADDGSKITELSENSKSTYITYDNIPKDVVNAFVAVEDRTFWTNKGVDLKGIARVLYTFVRSGGKTANGASTITQQLVKLTYLSSEKTLSRKVKEIVIALEITKKYSKEEIMEFYVNTCCFANGIYGIQDAAEEYLGKKVSELTLSECAYLCAIPNRPEYYNPKTNPDNAIKRRDKILDDMQDCSDITEAECKAAKSEKIELRDFTVKAEKHNYETTYAINCAVKYLMGINDFQFQTTFDNKEDEDELLTYTAYQEAYSEAYAQAKHELYTGGYEVYTTINMSAQKKLQTILNENLSDFTKKDDNGIYQVQGSMTVIDNDTGKVIAAIGGRSQSETSGMYTLNRVYQGYQQPGSSIKPLIVYTPALEEEKYKTSSILQNIDVSSAKKKSAKEISQMEGSPVTLRYAVENSLNGCAYWLFANQGVNDCMKYLTEMGFGRIVPDDYNMSACLGGLNYGVTTEEMANAYYTLENDGVYQDTDCLLSIININGQNIYEAPEETRVYSTMAAQKITDVMKGVLTDGTAKKSKWYKKTSTEAAGKTGTTNDNKAAWFCGYTPYYTISVWVGCDTPKEIKGLSGSSYPLAIWKESMLYLIDGKPTKKFPAIEEEEDIPECICSLLCTEDAVNDQCPACLLGIENCVGVEAECICEEKCFGDSLNETCPVCMNNPDDCAGRDMTCTCTEHCTATSVNTTCNLCYLDYNECCAPEKEQEPEEPADSEKPGQADQPSDSNKPGESKEPENTDKPGEGESGSGEDSGSGENSGGEEQTTADAPDTINEPAE